MQQLPTFADPNLLVGPEHFSDSGVYRLANGLAIVQSLDFFPPLVDDPFVFGQIAAANALSDLYAAGATPRTALNIVGFPDQELPYDVLQQILAGGSERILAAGAVVLGGHSVRDAEIKYGLAVTGVVDPAHMMTNRSAKPGDVLVLTKPLGTGFVTTANRAGRCPPEVLAAACESMMRLNDRASAAALRLGSTTATDITGFGLVGHAIEMAMASGVSIHVDVSRLPLVPGSEALVAPENFTRANNATRGHYANVLRTEGAPDPTRLEYIFDPQTSGGLLIALDESRGDELVRVLREEGDAPATVIGRVSERGDGALVLHP